MAKENDDFTVGFEDLGKELEAYLKSSDNAIEALELGAKAFVDDLKKLPKPYREVRKAGYTHLIDSFAYKVNKSKKDVTVGWGKYYGVMLEFGAVNYRKSGKQTHIAPTFEKNSKRYYEIMKKAIGL